VRNVNGVTTVFGVVGKKVDARCRAAWLHVALPIRPNGATGCVRAADVQQLPVRTRITVDLSERRVRARAQSLVRRTAGAHGLDDIWLTKPDRGQGPAHGNRANHGCRRMREVRHAASGRDARAGAVCRRQVVAARSTRPSELRGPCRPSEPPATLDGP
jgi:hypothetical protein